jgi:membrane protein implicated in regulation of membrane protease activity
MRIRGLKLDEELIKCAYLLIIGLVALSGGVVSLLLIILGLPYEKTMMLVLFVIGIGAVWKSKKMVEKIELEKQEYEAHEHKEELEREF